MLRPGWLKRQAKWAKRDIASWPAWLRKEILDQHPKHEGKEPEPW